jgi:hypothetical protein
VSRFLYFDPHLLRAASDTRASDNSLGPRLLFEDLPLWPLMMTLKGLLDEAFCVGQRYFEAIGIMLVQELVRYRDADTARYPRAARSLEPMSFSVGPQAIIWNVAASHSDRAPHRACQAASSKA